MGRSASFMLGASRPVPMVAAASQRYGEMAGVRPMTRDFSTVAQDPVVGAHIAGLYERAPEFDSAAVPSFRAMREETLRQHDFMTRPTSAGGMGLTHVVTPHDPYVTPDGKPDSAGMMRDVSENHRIQSMATATTGEHPFFTNDENDQFRAVHDVFGHAGTGRDFSRHGEEAAWRKHVSMYTPAARPAMTAETRGQNSAMNYGSVGGFQQQKVATLGPTAQAIGRRSLGHMLGRQFTTPSGLMVP